MVIKFIELDTLTSMVIPSYFNKIGDFNLKILS
jgi:hypothetical protein